MSRGTGLPADVDFQQVIDVARRAKGGTKQSSGFSNEYNQELLIAVVDGDRAKMEELFEEHPDLDVYTEDMAGRTPLHLAVDAGSMEIVGSILKRYNKKDETDRILIKSVLMGAISRDQELVSITLVQQARYEELFPPLDRDQIQPSTGRRKSITQTRPLTGDIFQNIDPIVLASQRNLFGLVQTLLKRGDYIKNPHEPSCPCLICKEMFSPDQLMKAKLRLETYRGLSSDVYVSLAAKDPIATAFSLGKELRQMASVEKHFKKEYLQLADNLSEYVYKLLDEVKTERELRWILDEEETTDFNEQLPRIKLAVENGEKRFVSHSSCQQKLTEIWYQDLRHLSNSAWRLWLIGLLYLMFSPFIWLVYLVSPKNKLGRLIRIPFLRFLSSIVWFVAFLITIVLLAYDSYLNDEGKKPDNPAVDKSSTLYQFFAFKNFPNDKGTRGEPSRRIILASLILCWVVGMLWTEVKKIYRLGYVLYCSDLFNIMESLVIIMYLMAIGLMFDTQRNLVEKQRLVIKEWSFNTMFDESSANQDLAREYWYWVIPDRHYWEQFDPSLVVDALLAAASVFAISKVFYYMAASSILGPLQIGFRRILRDVLKFLLFLFLLFMAFMVALQTLFLPFTVNNRKSSEVLAPDDDNPVSATINCGGLSSCLKTMFFAMFALGEYTAVDITDGSNPYTNLTFTKDVASIIYALYHFTMIVVLLNFFVAIMNETFEEVMESNDREWKFARAKLYLDFLTGGTQPSPLNFIPSFKAWFYFFTCRYTKNNYIPPACCGVMCGKGKIQPIESKETYVEEIKPNKDGVLADAGNAKNTTYQDVIYNLVKRFLQRKQLATDAETSGLEEMKKDIVSLRQQMEARILDHKATVKAAGDVTLRQNVTLTGLDNRLSDVEHQLKRMKETLEKFIKMLNRFEDIRSEMERAKLKSDEEAELKKKNKTAALRFAKIEVKKEQQVPFDTWSTASMNRPGNIPTTDSASRKSSTASAPGSRKSSTSKTPSGWQNRTARRTSLVPSTSESLDGSLPTTAKTDTAHEEGLQQPQAEVEEQSLGDSNTPEKEADPDKQQTIEADNLDLATECPSDEAGSSPLSSEETHSLRETNTKMYTGYDSTSNDPTEPTPSLPGDSHFDIDAFLATEGTKGEIEDEAVPDYTLPDDLPPSVALGVDTFLATEGTKREIEDEEVPDYTLPDDLPPSVALGVDTFLATEGTKGEIENEEVPDYTLPDGLPSSVELGVDAFLATEGTKGEIEDEEVPDYSLPDDLPPSVDLGVEGIPDKGTYM